MKRIFNCALTLALGLFVNVAQGASFVLPDYEKFTLENGLTVYLMEQDEVPLIDVGVVVKAGAVLDDKAGLATVTADNLLLGTQTLSKQAFEETLDFVGAQIGAGAGLEHSRLSLSMASKDFATLLPILFDATTNPAFDEGEFEKHRTRYIAALEQQKESPRSVIKSYFDAQLYAGHPYANRQSGTSTSVEGIVLEDVKRFHNTWYTPDNAAVVVTGDFAGNNIKKIVTQVFGKWQGQAPAQSSLDALPLPEKAQVLLVNKDDANESTFMIGGPGIAFSNKDYVAVSVINTILGGRFTSWLNDELRVNSGLTYGARSRFDTKLLGGGFYISSFTQSATTTQAMDLAIKTYQRLWEKGIDQATLDSAKAYVKGQFPPRYETSEQLADLLGDMFVYGFDENFINTFSQQVNQLNSKKAEQIVNQYFPKDKMQFVVVGKADEIRDKVAKYGNVLETDIKSDNFAL